jgi:cytochrome c553
MNGLTRRDFLRSSGAGVGLALGAGLGVSGCASTTTGDIAPKSGRRVVVIGGGWGGSTAAQCVICHGPDGKGDAARLTPGLAVQPPGYLAQQMALFKADSRDPTDPMLAATKALMKSIPDSQFADLAAYYSSLR